MSRELLLQRRYFNEKYTIGRLSVDDELFCDTLEDKVRDYNKDGYLLDDGEEKVYGETAIPYGRYRMTVSYSPKFKRDLPLLLGVPHFESIRIHAGNYAGYRKLFMTTTIDTLKKCLPLGNLKVV